ncbi:MAG: hypothetical protein V2B20_10260 [Pseudomonadota bacterium]
MNIHSQVQPYLRPMTKSGFRQHLCKQKTFPLLGDKRLWISVGKMLLVLCPMVLVGHLWLASLFKNLEKSVHAAENVHHELMDSQISLRTKRDQMFSPEWIQNNAAEKLSLHTPVKEQVMAL